MLLTNNNSYQFWKYYSQIVIPILEILLTNNINFGNVTHK